MTDAQQALAQVREALSAGPTPGPWHHCQPFQSVRAERTIHGPVPAQRVDFVSTKTQPVHERIIIPMAGREAHVRSEDMAFIAACNPENIAALLAHVDAQAAEIERLTAALRAQPGPVNMDDMEWAGKVHLAEAIRERDELRRQLAEADLDAQRYRWLRKIARQNTAYDVYKDGAHWSVGLHSDDRRQTFDQAIDAAMGLTRPAGGS